MRCHCRAQVKDVPAIKGVVRGKMGCSGWVVAPAQGGAASRVTYVSVTDLKVHSRAVPCHHVALHSTGNATAPCVVYLGLCGRVAIWLCCGEHKATKLPLASASGPPAILALHLFSAGSPAWDGEVDADGL